MPRIELNGEGEPVWLTPHLRDPQPEGERERERERETVIWLLSLSGGGEGGNYVGTQACFTELRSWDANSAVPFVL